jgi:hypothetical protein
MEKLILSFAAVASLTLIVSYWGWYLLSTPTGFQW